MTLNTLNRTLDRTLNRPPYSDTLNRPTSIGRKATTMRLPGNTHPPTDSADDPENKQFCYYGRGSLYETLTWLKKAHNRSLMSDADFNAIEKDINTIGRRLNAYIKSIGKDTMIVKESSDNYDWQSNDQ